jgi:hypothetical protein
MKVYSGHANFVLVLVLVLVLGGWPAPLRSLRSLRLNLWIAAPPRWVFSWFLTPAFRFIRDAKWGLRSNGVSTQGSEEGRCSEWAVLVASVFD